MELKWTSKALSDLARLYDFLVLASKPAAARTVQSLTQAPVILLTHPRMGEQLFQFEPREVSEKSPRPLAQCGRGGKAEKPEGL